MNQRLATIWPLLRSKGRQLRAWFAELLLALISFVPFVAGWLIGALVWLVIWFIASFQEGYENGRGEARD